ncbi:MAG TPA: DUF4124 domain-containing protein [Steroidobacteraceae bacterium]|nr:DUF4124 domain-containing protein [Steroidobacteraceae bacterium]
MHAALAVLSIALLTCASSQAQIYECAGKDGSRVFSDNRCGPDAKVVQQTKPKRPPPKGTSAKPVKTRKPAAELEELTRQCDEGDMKACTAWTMGGGPELLRDQERKAEQDCEAGSLAACEQRYCREGITADCRARVQRTARLAGDTWYLREETREVSGGVTKYLVRCIPEGAREARDIFVNCSSEAGPNRCYLGDPQHGFPRLAQAAAGHCARRPEAASAN